MAAVFDLSKIKSEADLATELRHLIDGGGQYYQWLEPIQITLDESVHEWLLKHPPRTDAYDIFEVEDHFSEAGALLDRCLQRRSEIQSLETQAIAMALDYKLAEVTQPFDLALAEIQMLANIKSSGVDGAAYKEALSNKAKQLTAARTARLIQHGRPGSALNFGERIDVLKELYADSIKTIFERLNVCRIGLKKYFGIEVDEEKVPFPSYQDTGNLILALIKWTRAAIDAYQVSAQKERLSVFFLRLSADGILPATDVISALTKSGDSTINFEIDAKRHLGFDPAIDICRIVGLGVSPVFKNNEELIGLWFNPTAHTVREDFSFFDDYYRKVRRTCAFTMSVQLPEQLVKVSGTTKPWPTEPISFSGVSAWGDGPIDAAVNLDSGALVRSRPCKTPRTRMNPSDTG